VRVSVRVATGRLVHGVPSREETVRRGRHGIGNIVGHMAGGLKSAIVRRCASEREEGDKEEDRHEVGNGEGGSPHLGRSLSGW